MYRRAATLAVWAALAAISAQGAAPARWQALERKGALALPASVSLVEVQLSHLAEERKAGRIKASGQMRGRLDDDGLKALTLLAYLGAGYTCKHPTKHRALVAGLASELAKLQKKDGRFSDDILTHALVCLALCESHAMDKGKVDAAQKGIKFLRARQLPNGGIPARVGGRKADNLTTIFAIMAGKSAKLGGLKVNMGIFRGLHKWLRARPDKKTGKVLGPDGKPDMAVFAGVAMSLMLMGIRCEDPQVARMIKAVAAAPPSHGKPDFLYWYFGTMVCFNAGGDVWKGWNKANINALLDYAYARFGGEGDKPPKELAGRIPGIVKRMGSDSWAVRAGASREALAMPHSALKLFLPHLKHKDMEVVLRVEEVVGDMLTSKTGDPYYRAISSLTLEIYYRYLPIYHSLAPAYKDGGNVGPMCRRG